MRGRHGLAKRGMNDMRKQKRQSSSRPALLSLADAATGRELDALVAQRVMGWHINQDHYWQQPDGGLRMPDDLPPYSSGGASMLKVLEEMRASGFNAHIAFLRCGVCAVSFVAKAKINKNETPAGFHEGDSLPEVVCRAALKAIDSEQANNPRAHKRVSKAAR